MRRCTPTCRGPWRPTSSPSSGKVERRTGQNDININETLHAYVSGAMAPYFKSFVRESGKADRSEPYKY
jgi:hypothetical protein